MRRWLVNVSGLVQGVGFRPFLFNLARRQELTGWVRNNFAGVELEIQGEPDKLASFVKAVKTEAPPAALVETITISEIPPVKEDAFLILASEFGQVQGSPLPDQGICGACMDEFYNGKDRRHHHPFNSCTVCGPRFTIIRDLPFDRNRTSMAGFNLCLDCSGEYTNPADRRFHAQTIACPKCGPSLWFAEPGGKPVDGDPGQRARAVLKSGGIIGVKGIGGYHLACLASAECAVEKLRVRKGRDNRAFAVMFRDLETLEEYCEPAPAEKELLLSPARPILLLPQRAGSKLARAVNPGLKEIGAFLPYTGIQLLLFDKEIDALVMTSGNRSGEPLTIEDHEAVSDLGAMVEGFLMHNREILWRCDDSVLRFQQGHFIGIRRSRGYVPAPVNSGRNLAPLLACGAQQKNVFAVTKGEKIYLSSHQGDLDNLASFLIYRETIERFLRLLQCSPEWVIHDLHPDYNSTIYAKSLPLKSIGIQHHLAHIASAVAACRIQAPVIGVAFDGSGYGIDGTVWGGEFFYGYETSWGRMGTFIDYPLPGGEAAIREPWRMAAAYLRNNPGLGKWLDRNGLAGQWPTLEAALKLGINSPLTSSVGRFFDGVAALTGGPPTVTYEGEAAIWLENQADSSVEKSYDFTISADDEGFRIDPGEVVNQVYQDLSRESARVISMKFHRTIATIIVETAKLIRDETACSRIVLSGGVFQNRLLLDLTMNLLQKHDFQVYVPEIVPVNDGGIALGQAWLGSLMIERGVTDVFSGSRSSN